MTMVMRARKFLAVALVLGVAALLYSTAPLQARIVDTFQLGSWSASAFTDDSTGAFDTCVASASYRNGISLYVQVDRMFNWALGFSAPTWQMTPGAQIPLQYRFDRGPWQQGMATAASETLARIQMPNDGYIVTRFRRGRVMYVYDGTFTYDFRLTGTSRLMQRMVRCVRTNAARFPGGPGAAGALGGGVAAGPAGGLGQPALGSAPQAPAQPALSQGQSAAADPALAVEATQALFNVMGQAGLTLTLVPDGQREDPDLNGLHAVATTGQRTLVAHIVPDTGPEGERGLMSQILADSAKECDGSFSSGTDQVVEAGKSLFTSFAYCEAGDVEISERVVLTPRSAGGLYIFGVRDTEVGEGGGPTEPLQRLSDDVWYAATAAAAN